ncbi:MAG: LOG family protein [Kiritimatiellia bacterium]|jgi:predicted Rossmann-fold nucleotide-binding protein
MLFPFQRRRDRLYSAGELFDAFDRRNPASLEQCLDSRIARHMQESGGLKAPTEELWARTEHDFHIRQAMTRFLADFDPSRVVAILGGHALQRTDPCYRLVVEVSKRLAERGRLMLSGGGPGAMEATHLGAWLAGRGDSAMDDALSILAPARDHHSGYWLSTAFEVIERFPQEHGFASLSFPTWHFDNEPSTPFATHIAKFFENSLREDLLLTEAYGGTLFLPGGPGTLQEIFQEAVQNHYVTLGFPSPMVFVGKTFWTETVPVFPLLETLVRTGRYNHNHLSLSLVDGAEEALVAMGVEAP